MVAAEKNKPEVDVSDLYEDMAMETYADSYDSINRNKPILAQTIIRLITAGETPAEIKATYMRRFPTSFPQAQKIYEAAWYVERAGLELD